MPHPVPLRGLRRLWRLVAPAGAPFLPPHDPPFIGPAPDPDPGLDPAFAPRPSPGSDLARLDPHLLRDLGMIDARARR